MIIPTIWLINQLLDIWPAKAKKNGMGAQSISTDLIHRCSFWPIMRLGQCDTNERDADRPGPQPDAGPGPKRGPICQDDDKCKQTNDGINWSRNYFCF